MPTNAWLRESAAGKSASCPEGVVHGVGGWSGRDRWDSTMVCASRPSGAASGASLGLERIRNPLSSEGGLLGVGSFETITEALGESPCAEASGATSGRVRGLSFRRGFFSSLIVGRVKWTD